MAPHELWVRLVGAARSRAVKTDDSKNIDDFIENVKKRFPEKLSSFAPEDITLHDELANDPIPPDILLETAPAGHSASQPLHVKFPATSSASSALTILTDPVLMKLEQLTALITNFPAFNEAPLNAPISAFVRSSVMPLYDPTFASSNTLWCVATGQYLPKGTVKAAHIFQKKWWMDCHKIGLSDVHDAKNIIPLFEGIEAVLDSGEILIYYNHTKMDYVIKLVNKSIAKLPLDPYKKTSQLNGWTYGDLHDKTLKFQTNLRPMRRAIQFLAQVARSVGIHRKWIGAQDLMEVIDEQNNSPNVLESGTWQETLEKFIGQWQNDVQ